MQEHVTLLGPEESPADVRGLSSSLPPDLMEQVRGRVRLLALLLLVAFLFDPLVYFSMWAIATVAGYLIILGQLGFRFIDLGAVAASGHHPQPDLGDRRPGAGVVVEASAGPGLNDMVEIYSHEKAGF
ncbi:MAG TPA: hypothetical protein VNO19_14495 [Gemmatimonadales bacterium]|nr:hypothetical protein [Gemmatimonadales bacterium]